MDIFMLDVVDVSVSRRPDMTLYVAIASTIVAEAVVMLLMRYNSFRKSAVDALVVNLVSVAVGYILLELAPGLFGAYDIPELLILLVITIAAELPILYLLNRSKRFYTTMSVAVVMNIVTYALFYMYILLSQR